MLTTSLHYQDIPFAPDGAVPDWLHLVPAGTFSGVDGRGPYHVSDVAELMDASMKAAGGKLVLDECHSTDTAARQGLPAPARGWIVELQHRIDGIWGRVEWTGAGRELMAKKEYRGISPVFTAEKNGRLVQLLRAALTNDPNLTLTALHTRQENSVDFHAALRQALGLAATADDAAILSAVTTQKATVTAHSTSLAAIAAAAGAPVNADGAAVLAAVNTQKATHAATITAIAAAAGATAKDAEGLVVELQAVRGARGEVATMAAQIVGLETQLNTMRKDGAKKDATAFIDAAIAAGKPIVALRDHYITRHMADAAAVEKEIGALISINAGGMPANRHDGDGGTSDGELSQEEMAVCRKMNVKPEDFKKTRAEMAKKKAA